MSGQLDDAQFMREKLFGGGKTNVQRYKGMVVGEAASTFEFLRYEIVTFLFGRMPGALGYGCRKIFYPSLFKAAGRGVIFGRDLTIRFGSNISLGERAVLDDGAFLDGRGAGEGGIVIGDRVVVGRGSTVQAKIGPITIGDDTDVGGGSVIVAQGGIGIGNAVVIGGGSKISGGVFHLEREKMAAPLRGTEGPSARGQARWTGGPIEIGDRAMLGMNAMVLDGVRIGAAAVIGAGAVVTRDVPAGAVAAGVPARLLAGGGKPAQEREPAASTEG